MLYRKFVRKDALEVAGAHKFEAGNVTKLTQAETVIGVCDWGIGGLGFARLLLAERPDLGLVYIGDQGAVSYGRLPAPLLAARIRLVLCAFQGMGITRVVVACNAASTVLDAVSVEGVTATGVIAPALRVLQISDYRTIGVIGGERTIRSQSYAFPLRESGHKVLQRVAQPLSGLIEQGKRNDPETLVLLEHILRPLHSIDVLTLACTHYIAVEQHINALLPGVPLIDPVAAAWQEIVPTLSPLPSLPCIGSRHWFTTGDPDIMTRQALSIFGIEASTEYLSLE